MKASKIDMLLGLLALALSVFYLDFFWHHLSDDACIAFQYVKQMGLYRSMSFQPQLEAVEGYTSFLWVLFLSMGQSLGIEPHLGSKLLTFLIQALLFVTVLTLAYQNPWLKFGFLAIWLNPYLQATLNNGEEHALVAFLILAMVLSHKRDLKDLSHLLAVFLVLARPEGLIYAAVLFIFFKDQRGVTLALGAYLVLALFRFVIFGEIFPHGLHTQWILFEHPFHHSLELTTILMFYTPFLGYGVFIFLPFFYALIKNQGQVVGLFLVQTGMLLGFAGSSDQSRLLDLFGLQVYLLVLILWEAIVFFEDFVVLGKIIALNFLLIASWHWMSYLQKFQPCHLRAAAQKTVQYFSREFGFRPDLDLVYSKTPGALTYFQGLRMLDLSGRTFDHFARLNKNPASLELSLGSLTPKIVFWPHSLNASQWLPVEYKRVPFYSADTDLYIQNPGPIDPLRAERLLIRTRSFPGFRD